MPGRGTPGADLAVPVTYGWSTGATGATGLADAIRAVYRHYVAFHSDFEADEAGTLTLWTMHTYVFDVADATPYILVTAPTSAAGKTRIFDTARCLVHVPYVAVDPTPASMFHAIDEQHPTVLLDEADMLRENKQLRSVLNAGFQPGTPVRRSKQSYDVFCPKAFSGITHEKPPLTEATLSRCIQIPMRRKAPDDIIARFHHRRAFADTVLIREALTVWAHDARDKLERADPWMPDRLTDRQEDSWSPLFAIADSLGGPWPADARRWAVTLSRAIPADPDPAVQILRDCKRVLDSFTGNRIYTAKLAAMRDALEDREYDEDLSPIRLARRLGGFGIRPDPSPWREGGKSSPGARGFVIRNGAAYTRPWADAFERYEVP
jgi:Protein of unknown function (DUF3631)